VYINKYCAEILSVCWSAHGGRALLEADLEARFQKADKYDESNACIYECTLNK
jgi:hypothetical protein